jgi:hypothetical protein
VKDLHSALKHHEVGEFTASGISFKHVRLQQGKTSFTESLHASPTGWTTYGVQATDYLRFLGFHRSACPFYQGECYSREISPAVDPHELTAGIGMSLEEFKKGARSLEACGIFMPQPEGWGFFFGKASESLPRPRLASVDGHTCRVTKQLKEARDDFFRFVFSWLETAQIKGWITHIRANHMPLSGEFAAALAFIGGFSEFEACPEFNFESCWWRGTAYLGREHDPLHNNAENAHRHFDALRTHFSPGIRSLLAANALVEPFGVTILATGTAPSGSGARTPHHRRVGGYIYDVALTFAGTERDSAESLADNLRSAGFRVFYDNHYTEQLWGKDLVAFFDRVYRKDSRYCVMFISKEYTERMWCIVERRSALARMAEQGDDYLLPVRVDDTDIDGLPPTIGRLSLQEHSIDEIGKLLVSRLKREVAEH